MGLRLVLVIPAFCIIRGSIGYSAFIFLGVRERRSLISRQEAGILREHLALVPMDGCMSLSARRAMCAVSKTPAAPRSGRSIKMGGILDFSRAGIATPWFF